MNNTVKVPLKLQTVLSGFYVCFIERILIVQDHLKSATERAELYKHLKGLPVTNDER